MNKTIPTWVMGGLIALLIMTGLIFYVGQNTTKPPDNTEPTPPATPTNTTQPKQPGAPLVKTSTAVVPSDTTVIVNGSVNPNGGFTSYWYEYGQTTSLGNKTVNQVVGSGFVAINSPAYITGLVKDTTYYFRLVASNQYGSVAGTQYSFQTTHGNPPPVGSIPTIKTIVANEVTRTTANINGEVTPNKASTQYWFEYGQTPNLGNTTVFESVGAGTTKLRASVSISNLNPATTYYFRINAQNQFGTVNGAILNFKTMGPPVTTAPAVVTKNATDVTASTTTLHGTINPNGAETKYWFEYSTDSLLGSVLLRSTDQKSVGSGINTISVESDVSDLSSKTNYYFRLVAQNNFGIVRGERMTFKTK